MTKPLIIEIKVGFLDQVQNFVSFIFMPNM